MGQYYVGVLLNKEGKKNIIGSEELDGLKLTEHSYLPNKGINKAMSLLLHEPQYVLWIGDYAFDDEKAKPIFAKFKLKASILDENSTDLSKIKPLNDITNYLLVNLTKKEYINLDTYFKDERLVGDLMFHPLSLLTAYGNGNGGGDYHGTHMEDIGRWAGDLIGVYGKTNKNVEKIYKECKELKGLYFQENIDEKAIKKRAAKVKGKITAYILNNNKFQRITQEKMEKGYKVNSILLWEIMKNELLCRTGEDDEPTIRTMSIRLDYNSTKTIKLAYGFDCSEKKVNENEQCKKLMIEDFTDKIIDWDKILFDKKTTIEDIELMVTTLYKRMLIDKYSWEKIDKVLSDLKLQLTYENKKFANIPILEKLIITCKQKKLFQ